MSAPTISTSIVLDSIELIRENAQRVLEALEAYYEQVTQRLALAVEEQSTENVEQFTALKERTALKLDTAAELIDWTGASFDDFVTGRVSAHQTLENTMLAGEMLRLVDPALKEQGA